MVLQDFLMNKVGKTYTDIFFIDDGEKNINDMSAAYASDTSINVNVFHHTSASKVITDADIQKSRLARSAMNAFLYIAFPDRYEANQANCF